MNYEEHLAEIRNRDYQNQRKPKPDHPEPPRGTPSEYIPGPLASKWQAPSYIQPKIISPPEPREEYVTLAEYVGTLFEAGRTDSEDFQACLRVFGREKMVSLWTAWKEEKKAG